MDLFNRLGIIFTFLFKNNRGIIGKQQKIKLEVKVSVIAFKLRYLWKTMQKKKEK